MDLFLTGAEKSEITMSKINRVIYGYSITRRMIMINKIFLKP